MVLWCFCPVFYFCVVFQKQVQIDWQSDNWYSDVSVLSSVYIVYIMLDISICILVLHIFPRCKNNDRNMTDGNELHMINMTDIEH